MNILTNHLNEDQIALLKEQFGPEIEAIETAEINFRDADHFKQVVNKKVCAVAAPMHIVLDVLIQDALGVGTTLIVWHADEEARKVGMFALAGASIYKVVGYELTSEMTPADIRYAEIRGMTTQRVSWSPSVMTDFETGESIPYKVG